MLALANRRAIAGTVTEVGPADPPPFGVWDDSIEAVVAVPDLEDWAVHLAVAHPAIPVVETCVFFSASTGEGDVFDRPSLATWHALLLTAGIRVVQVRWPVGWPKNNLAALVAGSIRLAARPAAVLRYVHARWHTTGWFAANGNSGGTSAICYALAYYGCADILDKVVLGGGPPHADIYLGCTGGNPWALLQVNNWRIMDDAVLRNIENACATQDVALRGGFWAQDSIIAGYLGWDATVDTLFVFGDLDTTSAVPQGQLLADRLPNATVAHVADQEHALWVKESSRTVIKDFLLAT